MSVLSGLESIVIAVLKEKNNNSISISEESHEKLEKHFFSAVKKTIKEFTDKDSTPLTDALRQSITIEDKMPDFLEKGSPFDTKDLLPAFRNIMGKKITEKTISSLLAEINNIIAGDKSLFEELQNLYLQIIIKCGKWDQVIDHYNHSLKMFEKSGDDRQLANTFNDLGLVYQNKGEWDKAIEYYNQSLDTFLKIDDDLGLAQTWGNLGNVYQAKAELDKAIDFYDKSLDSFETAGDVRGMALTYNNLGLIYQDKRDMKKAADFYTKSWEIFAKTGDFQGMAQSTGNLSMLDFEKNDHKKAIKQFFEILFLYIKYDAQDQINQAFSIIKYFNQQLDSKKVQEIFKTVQQELSKSGIKWGEHAVLSADEVKQIYEKLNQKKAN